MIGASGEIAIRRGPMGHSAGHGGAGKRRLVTNLFPVYRELQKRDRSSGNIARQTPVPAVDRAALILYFSQAQQFDGDFPFLQRKRLCFSLRTRYPLIRLDADSL